MKNDTLLISTRNALASIIADPRHRSATQLLAAVRTYVRRAASAGAGRLDDELLAWLSQPRRDADINSALPHRRPADISRTLLRLQRAGRVTTHNGRWTTSTEPYGPPLRFDSD